MWILIARVAFIAFKFFADRNKLPGKVAMEGGMRRKYNVLISGLMIGHKESTVFRESADSITVGVSNIGGSTLFTVTQTFKGVAVQLNFKSPLYGEHNMEWSFDEYGNQDEMVDRIANDFGQFQRNIMR